MDTNNIIGNIKIKNFKDTNKKTNWYMKKAYRHFPNKEQYKIMCRIAFNSEDVETVKEKIICKFPNKTNIIKYFLNSTLEVQGLFYKNYMLKVINGKIVKTLLYNKVEQPIKFHCKMNEAY